MTPEQQARQQIDAMLVASGWDTIATCADIKPREAAAFPAKSLHDYKFWPPAACVEDAFENPNLVSPRVEMEN